MLGFFARTIDDILPANPLVLFKKDQRVKLGKMFERGVSGFQDDASGMMRGYFEGKQYGSKASLEASSRVATTRKVATGVAGGLLAANYVDFNPLGATDLATNVAMLGVHGGIGTSMIRHGGGLSKGLGVGYLGLTAIGLMRRGDQPGPM